MIFIDPILQHFTTPMIAGGRRPPAYAFIVHAEGRALEAQSSQTHPASNGCQHACLVDLPGRKQPHSQRMPKGTQ